MAPSVKVLGPLRFTVRLRAEFMLMVTAAESMVAETATASVRVVLLGEAPSESTNTSADSAAPSAKVCTITVPLLSPAPMVRVPLGKLASAASLLSSSKSPAAASMVMESESAPTLHGTITAAVEVAPLRVTEKETEAPSVTALPGPETATVRSSSSSMEALAVRTASPALPGSETLPPPPPAMAVTVKVRSSSASFSESSLSASVTEAVPVLAAMVTVPRSVAES